MSAAPRANCVAEPVNSDISPVIGAIECWTLVRKVRLFTPDR